MPVVIALLRAVNVGGRNKIRMEALRGMCESLGCREVQTYVQSGNVLFETNERAMTKIHSQIEEAIENELGFRPFVITRTVSALRETTANNPFAGRPNFDPQRLLVTFLAAEPPEEARRLVQQMKTEPEEIHLRGREFYMYFPNGMGRPKTTPAAIEKALKVQGTGRNWNTVTKLLTLAEQMQTAQR